MEANCFRLLATREVLANPTVLQRKVHTHRCFIENLRLENVFEGHTGCVNCLDWNEMGTRLASGSDDTNVIIWDVFQHKNLHVIETQHRGNIFSVKFMPRTSDNIVATGAADGNIFLHDIIAKETVSAYNVSGRVKRLATTPAEPNLILSASEDGLLREYDTREPPSTNAKILIDLTKKYRSIAECKCVAISPTNPNTVALGANDPYVCVFDRRMPDAKEHTTYFIPGHLRSKQNDYKRQLRNMCITYVTFNPRGDEILVNLGGEHVYLFDLYNKVRPLLLDTGSRHKLNLVKKRQTSSASSDQSFNSDPIPKKSKNLQAGSSQACQSGHGLVKGTVKTEKAVTGTRECHAARRSDHYRLQGNELFGDEKYTAAIFMYNKAILSMSSSVAHSNRAAAFIKRSWEGDLYAALKDCYSALHTNPSHVKAHFRLIRCMYELQWFEEASICLKEFKTLHPEHSTSNACVALEKDIRLALKEKENETKTHMSEQDTVKRMLKQSCYDYKFRYCGHCNTTTDIKEANFFGANGQYIVAGSDEGSFFVWERETTNLVRVMQADSSIVNCLQPHPSSCLLATSGIDPVVKLWSPNFSDKENKHLLSDIHGIALENQKRMNTDPLESMLISMGMRFVSNDDENNSSEVMPCRTT